MARWVPGKIPDSDSYAPVRGRHMFAGELTIEDVCLRCNSGPLSRLDQRAEEWWDRNVRNLVTELHADEPILGRWLAKVAFNMQRIEKREGSLGREPLFPDDGIRWIIGKDKLRDSVGIVVGALPAGHDAALNAGHDGPPQGTPMPLRITHLLGLVFMTVWPAPNWDIPVAGMTKAICDTMPGVALDLERGRGPRQIPVIAKPDFVERGLYGNLALMNALHDRWERGG